MRSAEGCDLKKALSPAGKREVAKYLMETHKLSKSASRRLAGLSRTAHNRPRVDWLERDREIIEALKGLLISFPQSGFRKHRDLPRRRGFAWNKKRIYRVYRAMGLNLPRPIGRRLPSRNPLPLATPDRINDGWSADFLADALTGGVKARVFRVIGNCSGEASVIEADASLRSECPVRIFERLRASRGLPEALRVDERPRVPRAGLHRLVSGEQCPHRPHPARQADPSTFSSGDSTASSEERRWTCTCSRACPMSGK